MHHIIFLEVVLVKLCGINMRMYERSDQTLLNIVSFIYVNYIYTHAIFLLITDLKIHNNISFMIQKINFPIYELDAYSTTLLHLQRSIGLLYCFIIIC